MEPSESNSGKTGSSLIGVGRVPGPTGDNPPFAGEGIEFFPRLNEIKGLWRPIVVIEPITRFNPHRSSSPAKFESSGLPPSIPPGRTYQIRITIDPPSLTLNDFIVLTIENSGNVNGTATVSPRVLFKTTVVTVTGGEQTEPGHGGKLAITADLHHRLITRSSGFSVCAHPKGVKEKFLRDLQGEIHVQDIVTHGVGAAVLVDFLSDSEPSNASDMGEVRVRELVEEFPRNRQSPPFATQKPVVQNDRFGAPIRTGTDYMVTPRPSAGPAAKMEFLQVHLFKCRRCGCDLTVIPNSGYLITDSVFQDAAKKWKHRTTKKGDIIGVALDGTAFKSEAGITDPDPITSMAHDLGAP